MYKYFLIVFFVLLSGCAGKIPFENMEKGDFENSKRVLIAVQLSDYKNELLNAVINGLDSSLYVKVISIKDLPAENSEDYDAVAIIAEKRVFRINSYALDFIRNTGERDKIILFFTEAGNPKIPDELNDIDVVSSASVQDNLESMKEYIILKIEERL